MARSLEKLGGATGVGGVVGTTVFVARALARVVGAAGSARGSEDDDVHPLTTSTPAVSPSATAYPLMCRL